MRIKIRDINWVPNLTISIISIVAFGLTYFAATRAVYSVFTPNEMLNYSVDLLVIVSILIAFFMQFVDVGEDFYLNRNLDSEIINNKSAFKQFSAKAFRIFLYLLFVIPIILLVTKSGTHYSHIVDDIYIALYITCLIVLLNTLYSALGLLNARRDIKGHNERGKNIIRHNIFSQYQKIISHYLMTGKNNPIDYIHYTINDYSRDEQSEYLLALFNGEYSNEDTKAFSSTLPKRLFQNQALLERRLSYGYIYLKDKWTFLEAFNQHHSGLFTFLQDQLQHTTNVLHWLATNFHSLYIDQFTGKPVNEGNFSYSKNVDRIFCYAQSIINNILLTQKNVDNIRSAIVLEATQNNYKVMTLDEEDNKTKNKLSTRAIINNTNNYTYELGISLLVKFLNSEEYIKQINRGNAEDLPAELIAYTHNNHLSSKSATKLDTSYLEILKDERIKNDVALCNLFGALTFNSQLIYLFYICSKYNDNDEFCRPLVTNFLFFNKLFPAHIVDEKIIVPGHSFTPMELADKIINRLTDSTIDADNIAILLMDITQQSTITYETYQSMMNNNFGFIEYLLLRIMFTSVSSVSAAIPSDKDKFFGSATDEQRHTFKAYLDEFRTQYGTRITKITQKLYDFQ